MPPHEMRLWPAHVIADLRAYWDKYPFGPEIDRVEDARLIATIKNGTMPRKSRAWTVEEHVITQRKPMTDDDLNRALRTAFGYYSHGKS